MDQSLRCEKPIFNVQGGGIKLQKSVNKAIEVKEVFIKKVMVNRSQVR